MKTLSTIFLLFLSISCTLAEAQDNADQNLKEYDIEIIIFEDAHVRYINSEMWHQNMPDDSEPLTYTNHLSNDLSINQNKVTENLKKTGLGEADLAENVARAFVNIKPVILNKEYNRINNSSEYEVMFYGAWRQAGLDESRAFEINLNELDNSHISKSENSITGHIKVVLARYLHFYSQLDYQRQDDQYITTENSADETSRISAENNLQDVNKTDVLPVGNNIYTMENHRRMRSKELHYIDHPLVGILVQINTVIKP